MIHYNRKCSSVVALALKASELKKKEGQAIFFYCAYFCTLLFIEKKYLKQTVSISSKKSISWFEDNKISETPYAPEVIVCTKHNNMR